MARLLYGNFDFEHELATPHYNRPKRLARLNAELAACLIGFADDHDQIWCSQPLPENYADRVADAGLPPVRFVSHGENCQVAPNMRVELAPWGWSAAAVEFARQMGATVSNQNLDAVRKANSRGYSFSLEKSLQESPPGAFRLESSRKLVGAIAESASAWNRAAAEHRVVLKAEFGMSGRERISLRGDEVLSPSVHGWINRRVEQSGAVYLEPWLDSVAEFSTHWDIAPVDVMIDKGSGKVQAVWPVVPSAPSADERVYFVGQTQLLNTPQGQYAGSRVGATSVNVSDEELHSMLSRIETVARQAAETIAKLGYTGTLGIDAMIYRDAEGCLQARPLQDINARWSMGRIALALQQRFAPNGCLSLLRVASQGDSCPTAAVKKAAASVGVLRLTPDVIANERCSEDMIAVWADSASQLQSAEQQLLGQVNS